MSPSARHPLPSRCGNQTTCDDPPARSTRRRNSFDELLWYSNVSWGKRRKADAELTRPAAVEAGVPTRARRDEAPNARALRRSWAQLIKRIYEVDPLVCPKCGSEIKVIVFIIDHAVVDRILRHLKRTEGERGRGRHRHTGFDAVL